MQYNLTQWLFITSLLMLALIFTIGVFIMAHNKSKYGKSFFEYLDGIPESHKEEVEKLKNIL